MFYFEQNKISMVVFSSGQTVEQLNKIQTMDVENRFSGWLGVFIHGNINIYFLLFIYKHCNSVKYIIRFSLTVYVLMFLQMILTKSFASKCGEPTRPCAWDKSKSWGPCRDSLWLTVVSTVIPPYSTGSARMKR